MVVACVAVHTSLPLIHSGTRGYEEVPPFPAAGGHNVELPPAKRRCPPNHFESRVVPPNRWDIDLSWPGEMANGFTALCSTALWSGLKCSMILVLVVASTNLA